MISPIFLRRCKYTSFFQNTNVSNINRFKNDTRHTIFLSKNHLWGQICFSE